MYSFNPFPQLITTRLILREITIPDQNEIFALSIILEFLLLIIFVFRFKGIQIV